MGVSCAFGARGSAQQREQRVRVEPALAGAPERAEHEVRNIQPRKFGRQRIRIEQDDVGAFSFLYDVVRDQRISATLSSQQKVAALAKRNVGVWAEPRFQVAEERDAEAAHPDVLRRGELLADRSRRERGCGMRIGRVAFDHRDRAGKA